MYATILAGGGGSRLWPLSRNNTPKQLLTLVSPRSMLQETVDRLTPLMPPENIVVVTGEKHADQARAQLPEVPPENIVVEPAARGTAPAIGLGLLHIIRLAAAHGETDPVVGSFHADHVITDVPEFQAVVRDAAAVAESGCIVTLGITPDHPHTGYGYIERDGEMLAGTARPAYRVARFVEKPPLAVAQEYLATGRYSWNSGMFIWKLSTIMNEFERYQPELARRLSEIGTAMDEADYAEALPRLWHGIRTETIDVGIAEKSDRMAVIPADFGWSDVGDWSAVADMLAAKECDDADNAVRGLHLGIQTSHSLIYETTEGKLIATIGMKDVVIIDTPDVLLVCDRARNQDVKKVVEDLRARGGTRYL
ncbi:MAG TPA: mannose-1-phosphate guanylyltransferase [Chloroflexia bacterium]|nr:mannose-1-phosphate guanylyltransferase [Chloroflexia bacterium]